MRPLISIALLGSSLSMHSAAAQSATEQPTPGTTRSKPTESRQQHDDSLFENGPAVRKRRAEIAPPTDTSPNPTPAPPSAPPPVQALPTVQAVPPGPPQKNLTGEEFKFIRIGSTAREVLQTLGPPSSRLVVPDDDGHLRETFQYWVKGAPMGTVRLDNGRVVQIETNPK